MANFQKIPNLSIDGNGGAENRPVFGGYIYSMDYDVKVGSEGNSTIVANIVSEDGNYTITTNDLNLNRVYNISIGNNIKLPMYLKSYRKINAVSGKLLELEFIDGSFIMDRYFIGLYKKQGANRTVTNGQQNLTAPATQFGSPLSCMIIVGIEHHPCDRNYDGVVTPADIEDPCHPCNKDSNERTTFQRRLVQCDEAIKYSILDVTYNFTELIAALTIKGFKLKNAVDPNPFYKVDYIGSVRQVLSNFCADFGWIFYWEDGTIIFRDLRSTINVNATVSQFCPNIESTEEEYTLDGTVSTATITNYSRVGRGKDRHECQDAIHVIIPAYDQSSWNYTPLAITRSIDENAAAFSIFHQDLRKLYYWFSKYQMNNINNIQVGRELTELGMTILSESITLGVNTNFSDGNGGDPFGVTTLGITTELDEGGNLLPFLSAGNLTGQLADVQEAIFDDDNFRACFELLPVPEQWRLAANTEGKYFFFAAYDPSVEQIYESDENAYAGFLGKYHIFVPNTPSLADFFENKKFIISDESGCGTPVYEDDASVSWNPIDINQASMEFYNNTNPSERPDTLSNLPFANFLAVFKDRGASIQTVRDFKLVVISKNGDEWNPHPSVRSASDSNDIPEYNINNQDLIEKAASWLPKQLSLQSGPDGIDSVEKILQRNVPNDRSRIFCFLGSAGVGIQYAKTNSTNPNTIVGKPFSGKPLDRNQTDDPDLRHKPIYQYPELRCAPIGNLNNLCWRHTLTTPVGQFYVDAPTYSVYGVVIEKTKQVVQKLRKVESILQAGSCAGTQALEFRVNYKNISDQTINDIKRLPDNTSCTYNLDQIKKVHENYTANLAINQTVPLIKKTFTIAGIDLNPTSPKPTIDNGLLGLKISVGTDGISSTYIFGTTIMKPPTKPEVYQLDLGSSIGDGTLSDTWGLNPINSTGSTNSGGG